MLLERIVQGELAFVVQHQQWYAAVAPQAHAQLAVVFEQRGIGKRLEAQLVRRIGGVGDQLAQEYFFVGVEAVSHQAQQLFDFSLKAVGFGVNTLGHRPVLKTSG